MLCLCISSGMFHQERAHLEVVNNDAALPRSATKEGNALCMLAQAQVHVAEGCLQSVLRGCQSPKVRGHRPAQAQTLFEDSRR